MEKKGPNKVAFANASARAPELDRSERGRVVGRNADRARPADGRTRTGPSQGGAGRAAGNQA
ncbi:hypothetical protein GCM10010372_08240 [Streptomyces tauricus]|nr:hypothetical protein GCM10010372_08240 [Streptomyces tauricus]